jgi:hypothetical protein
MKKAAKLFARYRETIVPMLVVVVAALVLANFVKHGLLTASRLEQSKDALSALQSAVQVLFIMLGAVFSYYRFFRGRTFVSRGDITITATVIETTADHNLHWVSIEFKNLGTVSVWDPKPEVIVFLFGPNGIVKKPWTDWHEAGTGNERTVGLSMIDSGETATFTTYHEVPKTMWAVEYQVFVTDADGIRWKRATMIENKAKPNKLLGPS